MKDVYEKNPDNVKNAEIVVMIPPHDDAARIASSAKKADEGLIRFFPDHKAVILHSGNSPLEKTGEAFLDQQTETPKIHLFPEGAGDKGNSLRYLFRRTVELNAAAAVLLNPENRNTTPRWIKNLGDPLFRNFEFVAPLCLRSRFEGTIIKNIAYPLTRSLYGRRVRQPLAAEVGLSGQFVRQCLEEKLWNHGIAHVGIDIWLITVAMIREAPICQSFMGQSKEQTLRDALDLDSRFGLVVNTIFFLMRQYAERWKQVKWSKPTAIFGFGLGETEMPPETTVDKERLYSRFTDGVEQMNDRWKAVLAPEVFSKVSEAAGIGAERFDFPTELWAKVLFDYAIAFRAKHDNNDSLLDSLQPLYHGRVLSYVNKVEAMSTQQAEEYVEDQCLTFEETKPYLIQRWEDD